MGLRALLLALAAALLSCAAGQGAYAPVELGLGSLSGSGAACGFTLSPGDWPCDRLASIDPVNSPFAGGQQQGCGVCLEVQCTAPGCAGASTVVVADHCDGCGSRVFLSQAAWSQAVQGSALQQLPGQVRQVACTPPGNLQPQVTEYRAGDGGYLKLALQSVAGNGDLVSVEVKGSSQVRHSVLPASRTSR